MTGTVQPSTRKTSTVGSRRLRRVGPRAAKAATMEMTTATAASSAVPCSSPIPAAENVAIEIADPILRPIDSCRKVR